MKPLAMFLVAVMGVLLIIASADLPPWGDENSPANSYLSPQYIENSLADTGTPNMVTAVLADYRGYDTMFETAVIFCAGMAIIGILGVARRRRHEVEEDDDDGDDIDVSETLPPAIGSGVIVLTAARILLPVMQLFALYVVAHGHHSPGGGFQGGVILGASLIMIAIAGGLPMALKRMSNWRTQIMSALGLMLYAGVGVLCVVLGGEFLDYEVLSLILPDTDRVTARAHGIMLVEIGVALTVMAVMFAAYAHLASGGRLDEGV